ncbi:MAG: GyrI-like domain-containing protein [Spirochaetes bacterium]|nr:GyrI-like domain-containing protein [Spirochaetota bacterium]
METYALQGGLYAVFDYQGRPSEFAAVARHIFQVWLPPSAFVLDNREHFEVLGSSYRPDDPDVEETIWIPVKQRG